VSHHPKTTGFLSALRVGYFLAFNQVRRGNPWTNLLIVFIMVFTFLNLVVVSGILVGLIEGSVQTIKQRFTGDLIISNLKQRPYIDQTPQVVSLIESIPAVENYTVRYLEAGKVESNYKIPKKKETDLDEDASAIIAGINPTKENLVTGLSELIIKGSYLEANDYDQVIVGAMLLKQYLDFEAQGFSTLANVDVGSKIRVTVNGFPREVTVKGIVKSKVDEIDRRVFFTDSQFRNLIGRFDYNADEIAIKLKPGTDPYLVKNMLLRAGAGELGKVQTQEDAEPKFVKDMKQTFALLGNIISSIGLVVAAITIFIVIFINAITRRKFIGILKGIGIEAKAIEIAYTMQAMFYAFLGTALGCILVFGIIKPYLDQNPINFPFSDGILVATLDGTLIRIGVLFLATFISGYIPARIVVKQNTLDSILGR
jgi:ABC-type lipoprotein release transport system permease subunit